MFLFRFVFNSELCMARQALCNSKDRRWSGRSISSSHAFRLACLYQERLWQCCSCRYFLQRSGHFGRGGRWLLMCSLPSLPRGIFVAMNTDPKCNFMSWNNAYNRENNAYNSRIIEITVSDQHIWCPSRWNKPSPAHHLARHCIGNVVLLVAVDRSLLGGACARWNLLWNPRIIGIIVKIMKIIVMGNTGRDALYWICVPSCKSSSILLFNALSHRSTQAL